MLIPDEHLFLFPAPALRVLLEAAGFAAITEQPSAFPQYDITVSASAGNSGTRSQAKAEPPPIAAALITLFDTNRALHEHCRDRERDADARLQLLHEAESRLIQLERECDARLKLLQQTEPRLIQLERDATGRLELLGKADVALRQQISLRQESEQALRQQISLRNESEQAYVLAFEQWRTLVFDTCNQCLDKLQGLSSRSPLGALGWLMGRRRKYRELLAATAEVDGLVRSIPAIRQGLERTILAGQRRLSVDGNGRQDRDETDLRGGLPNTALTPEVLRAHLDAVEKLAVRLVFLRELLARELKASLHR